jgi:hypothetical protein
MLIHSAAPLAFWAEALATATYLINRRPCRTTAAATPYSLLFGVPPNYDELRVFGCLCYPTMISTSAHKLAPRSTTCVFLGYPGDHRGYRCYDITTGRVITSRHVVFNEAAFPFRDIATSTPTPGPAPAPIDDDTPILDAELPRRPRRARPARSDGTAPMSSAPPSPPLPVAPPQPPVHHFLGINVRRTNSGFFLSQTQYVDDLLERAGMANCKSVSTPADTKGKVSATDGTLIADATSYRSLAGALQYLTITRPDIAYAVQQVCLHMHAPRDVHLTMLKRILRYIKGTAHLGVQLRAITSPMITAYSDADWAGCPDTRRSTSGYCIFLGPSLISWSSKRQTTVSRSSAEAVSECSWLRHLLGELLCKVPSATVAFCDNISSVYMSKNPVHHRRTKHIELDIHFVREKVAIGELRVTHVPSARQLADVFTKGLPSALFNDFRDSLSVTTAAVETAGGCQRSTYNGG